MNDLENKLKKDIKYAEENYKSLREEFEIADKNKCNAFAEVRKRKKLLADFYKKVKNDKKQIEEDNLKIPSFNKNGLDHRRFIIDVFSCDYLISDKRKFDEILYNSIQEYGKFRTSLFYNYYSKTNKTIKDTAIRMKCSSAKVTYHKEWLISKLKHPKVGRPLKALLIDIS